MGTAPRPALRRGLTARKQGGQAIARSSGGGPVVVVQVRCTGDQELSLTWNPAEALGERRLPCAIFSMCVAISGPRTQRIDQGCFPSRLGQSMRQAALRQVHQHTNGCGGGEHGSNDQPAAIAS